MNTAVIEENCFSCTFLNSLGDITIVWDEQNKEHILEVIRKKMSEGYSFFTTKKYMFGKITRKSAITTRDLNRGKIEDIIITDEEFDKMVTDMKDEDIASLVRNKQASPAKIKGKKEMTALVKASKPEDVIASQSVGIKPIRGG